MAENKKYTAFERLQMVLSNGNKPQNYITSNNYDLKRNNNDDIIATYDTKEEYEQGLMQAKQQSLLLKQWKKANYDADSRTMAGLNELKRLYIEADLMDAFPEIGAALDIVSEEACYISGDTGCMVNINSRSDRIKSVLEDLFVNRLSIHTILPMICRSMCKYGNTFMLLNVDAKNGVMGWKQLPVYEVERWENGQQTPYATATRSLKNIDDDEPEETKFIWIGQNEYIPYRNWQMAHFRLLYDSLYLPYGCLVGDTRIETEFGYKEISNIEIGDKVWTFNIDTQERELSDVTMKMNKGVKPVYLLETKHYSIEATDDHKILCFENGKLTYKEVGLLNTNDFVVCNNGVKENYKEVIIDKTPLKEYESSQKSNKWWDLYINNIPENVNCDFAKLFGFLLGDGWISHGCHVMFAMGVYNTLNEKYIKLLEKFSGKEIHFVSNKHKKRKLKFHTAYVGSKMLVTILKRMGFVGDVYTKRIPEWVFNTSKEIRESFIDGLIDADGSLSVKNDKIVYNIELANEQLIKDIKTLVLSLGYRVGRIGKRERIGYKSKSKVLENVIVTHCSFYLNFYKEKNLEYKNCKKIKWNNEGLILEKVKKVIPLAPKITYDITVNNTNSNFFANNIVTHNCSFLNKARRHFRMLSMMEDLMLIYRLDRSIERRVFKINVGAIDNADVPAFVEEIANNFKRKPIVDPLTGQIDLRKSFMNVTEDYFIPVRDDNASSPIETLQGAQNLTAMDDIKFVQNKLLTALRVPRSFLNFEETTGDGKNLSLLDVRFTRTVNRIQQALLMELNKIAVIHLYLTGFRDDLNNFTLSMNNPSSQAEMLELENLAKKITTAKDAVSDPGGGIPLTSLSWAWKHIFKWSDKEIKQNLEEIRLETALSGELQKTMEIIKRTRLFDAVDNIYGEPGAEYSEGQMGEEGEGPMGGEPGGGGGMPMGGGDLDFGEDMGDEMGAEGEMDMGMAAEEAGAPNMGGGEPSGAPEGGGNQPPTPNLSDSLLRNMEKKLIIEREKLKKDLDRKAEKYTKMLKERREVYNKEQLSKPDIFDKAFFINEEMDTLKHQLEELNEGVE